jgi:hypothetical protein
MPVKEEEVVMWLVLMLPTFLAYVTFTNGEMDFFIYSD